MRPARASEPAPSLRIRPEPEMSPANTPPVACWNATSPSLAIFPRIEAVSPMSTPWRTRVPPA
ncbi:Uncharacterised protein [Bordetella pertussis]|nr:Uncharacterised protein [Bordetella pertussis]